MTKCIVQRHRRDVDEQRSSSSSFYSRVDCFQQVQLDCDQYDLNLFVDLATNDLIIPNDFINGRRHILLRFKLNNAFDLFFIDHRELYETCKDRLVRNRITNFTAADSQVSHHFAQCELDLLRAHSFCSGIDENLPKAKPIEYKAAFHLPTEFCQTKRL